MHVSARQTQADGESELIRVKGLVQGVGFRPFVWRLARAEGLAGGVCNAGSDVLITAIGSADTRNRFVARLRAEAPPLARIETLERESSGPVVSGGFDIWPSVTSARALQLPPDRAPCPACRAELFDPANRRYRYPLISCAECGPRASVILDMPYDRGHTTLRDFSLCRRCAAEYHSPEHRRFHAQTIACAECGPRLWLQDLAGNLLHHPGEDAVQAASRMLRSGAIVALKGVGGFHLACDAGNEMAVAALRKRKQRPAKPFALMADSVTTVARYCVVPQAACVELQSLVAPVVLLERCGDASLAESVAPGQALLGFMLPSSPLHLLLMSEWSTPLVMTSGNATDEPPCTDNDTALRQLAGIADAFLLHDRAIVRRLDDSVVSCFGRSVRVLRRGRGLTGDAFALPPGFASAPAVLAVGGQMKSALALLQNGQAFLSQHLGDLNGGAALDEFTRTTEAWRSLFGFTPDLMASDLHPDYATTRWAEQQGVPLGRVQHHHAHIAACLADNAWPRDGAKVLGLAFDGIGMGEDGTLWGGEFLLADYCGFERLGSLRPVAMPGGTRAITEPWRMTFAHLTQSFEGSAATAGMAQVACLRDRPLALLNDMLARRVQSPLTSSVGRLFDAVAAAIEPALADISFEGQAALRLEQLATAGDDGSDGDAYSCAILQTADGWLLDPAPLWVQLLADLAAGLPPQQLAWRFHAGLADAAVAMVATLHAHHGGFDTVALSGGVFQNRLLSRLIEQKLVAAGFRLLVHGAVPCNDGGLAFGQAVVVAARALRGQQAHA